MRLARITLVVHAWPSIPARLRVHVALFHGTRARASTPAMPGAARSTAPAPTLTPAPAPAPAPSACAGRCGLRGLGLCMTCARKSTTSVFSKRDRTCSQAPKVLRKVECGIDKLNSSIAGTEMKLPVQSLQPYVGVTPMEIQSNLRSHYDPKCVFLSFCVCVQKKYFVWLAIDLVGAGRDRRAHADLAHL